MLVRTATLFAMAFASACTVNFDPGTTRFSCDDGECPSGQTCINAICQPTGFDASIDAPDGDVPECRATTHLVLSEVNVRPDALEFIEISNPTNVTLDLTGFYISDDPDYSLIAGSASVTQSDFIYKFPDAQSIAAGATLTIAFNETSYTTQYGTAPDLTLATMTKILPMAAGTPAFNDAGEWLVLFQWDGESDLVTDVDAVAWGNPNGSDAIDKTGISVDGPDIDTDTSTYLPDAATAPPIPLGAESQHSMHRVLGEGGLEGTGGNGVAGDDETSEPLDQTWAVRSSNPGSPSFCNP